MHVDWTSPIAMLAWNVGAAVIAIGLFVAARYAAAKLRASNKPLLVKIAPYLDDIGAIAYDAIAAASRNPGVISYAAARTIALAEAQNALQGMAPQLSPAESALGARIALGHKLQSDVAFSATGAATATATAEPGETATASAGPIPVLQAGTPANDVSTKGPAV